ncbi:translesion error-prone DNA polymerase V autoproteolytic subunit [Kiloniella laminariae]|uniref:Translesion error-prone DNA polymerase V autoproteolytic subunit n=1 Tax=Kiloniella laminariae TaxID=454162 RepID=A0ABT4LPQ9_9PROT|nr:translesion error-prone DNA polymerase V autoproteolytic subunit [Kiloniella laminariae]MCZ4283098.1 translesion error-prone DNA polymerase V autoproteolytic subunit [Kiloniella laminariae]
MTKTNSISRIRQAFIGSYCPLLLLASNVPAGFPSPAEDYIEGQIDLNEQLIRNPHSTFLMRVSGDSMIGAGIMTGSTLVVDRSIDPRHGNVVIAVIDGQLTVKRLYKQSGIIQLKPENPEYQVITISGEQDLQIWGVVTNVISSLG